MDPQLIYSIGQLNSEAKVLLEQQLGNVYVIGEMSNLARPSSGHVYFTLKDSEAQVRCAFFKLNRRHIDFNLENGQQVMVYATVSLYEGRGDYQLIVKNMQLAGNGALQLAFEKLKVKLNAEGLFDVRYKQAIPKQPTCIGVITSSSGAALRDILKVLRRRSPQTHVIIYPSLVQGAEAAAQLVAAIQTANQRNECDLLIVARGGGSLEDLWPFNEERVARALFASKLPIVTGIGHEVDVTIADFIADQRAATPSAAAEFVSSDQHELLAELKHLKQHLSRLMNNYIQYLKQQLNHFQKQLRHPRDKLREQAQTIDRLEQQLTLHMQHKLVYAHNQLQTLAAKLNALSPLATLQRGYAIVTNQQHHAIDSISKIKTGDQLTTQLNDGSFTSTVSTINIKK